MAVVIECINPPSSWRGEDGILGHQYIEKLIKKDTKQVAKMAIDKAFQRVRMSVKSSVLLTNLFAYYRKRNGNSIRESSATSQLRRLHFDVRPLSQLT